MSYSRTKLDKTMNPEQFNQVVEAILAGKYSWACVLILRFAGYNPLHYIPYRTYNRLAKENCQIGKAHQDKTDSINTDQLSAATKSDGSASRKCLSKITDIDYLEVVNEQHQQVRGGNLEPWLKSSSLQSEGLLSNCQGLSAYN
jgi:hypothetical protein